MTEVETPPLRVRELRRALGWNQTELAYRAGTSPSTISHLENGNHIPNLRFLARVAAALSVEVRDLFVEIPGGEPPPPSERGSARTGFDAGEVSRRGPSKGPTAAAIAMRHALRVPEHIEARLRYLEELRERIALARELLAQEAENDELRARREALAAELEAGSAELESVARELRAKTA
jgi:transcriptional regulator with XRE-family HTH domain